MAYRLSRRETLHAGALRICREELLGALAQLRGEGPSDPRVHAARKAIKRVRALLRLLRRPLGTRFSPLDRALRDAGRGLSSRRDAAVASATLLVLAPEPPYAPVREALALRSSAGAADERALADAAGALERVLQSVEAWPELALGWPALRDGLRDSYRGGRRAMRRAYAEPEAEAFHEWRKRAKELWYHTLLLQGVWKTHQLGAAGSLEELAELLGADHDLEVVRLALASLDDLDPELLAAIEARAALRAAELRAAARALGRRIYAERPSAYLARLRCYWDAWVDESGG